MKLATYRDGSRDGQLVVVSRDLAQAHYTTAVATRLQQVLDDWNFLSPQLHDLYLALNQGKARHAFAFEPQRCMAPLPRAYQWAYEDGRGGLAQGSGDGFLGATEPARFGAADWPIDVDPFFAAITGDVDAGAARERALESIRLLTVAARWRAEVPGDATRIDPPAAFAPLALTPDELGAAFGAGRLQLRLRIIRGGQTSDAIDAAASFGDLIARLARTRPVRAGSIVAARATGAAERSGDTPLRFGDLFSLDALGADGMSVFGAIGQRIAGWADDGG